jgi:hypothetical protein
MRMFLPAEKLWDRPNRIPVLLASAAMIVAIALLDWWTTPYVSLGLLYLLPIVLVSGFLPRPALVSVCAACAVLSEVFSSLDPTGRTIRLILEMLALGGFGLFVSELLRNRRLSLETQERLRALVETSPAAIVTLNQRGVIEVAKRRCSAKCTGATVKPSSRRCGFLPTGKIAPRRSLLLSPMAPTRNPRQFLPIRPDRRARSDRT